jgi:hypothetical protein
MATTDELKVVLVTVVLEQSAANVPLPSLGGAVLSARCPSRCPPTSLLHLGECGDKRRCGSQSVYSFLHAG